MKSNHCQNKQRFTPAQAVAKWVGCLRGALLVSTLVVPAIALTGQAARADKENFSILNSTDENVMELYITASYESNWGDSLLDEGGMPSGSGVQIEFNDPSQEVCKYDIRTVFANGQTVEDYGVNVCANDYYSLVD